MARLAVVNAETRIVENVIEAELSDTPPDGCILVDGADASTGDVYLESGGFDISEQRKSELRKKYKHALAELKIKAARRR